jgi:hypothetical protein
VVDFAHMDMDSFSMDFTALYDILSFFGVSAYHFSQLLSEFLTGLFLVERFRRRVNIFVLLGKAVW